MDKGLGFLFTTLGSERLHIITAIITAVVVVVIIIIIIIRIWAGEADACGRRRRSPRRGKAAEAAPDWGAERQVRRLQ